MAYSPVINNIKAASSLSLLLFLIAFTYATPSYSDNDVVPLTSQTLITAGLDQSNTPPDAELNTQHYHNAIVSSNNYGWQSISSPDGNYQTWKWEVSYNLGGKFKRLIVDAGIQDGAKDDRVDHFEIHGNGKNFGITPAMHAGDTPEHFDIDVTGIIRLDLIVTSDIHDSSGGKDGAVWGDPTLFTDGNPNTTPAIYHDPFYEKNFDIFSWKEVPINIDVPVTHVVMDSRGYHIFDTQNEVIIVPFNQMYGQVNIYVLKIGRSPDNNMHFVNEVDAPVLYLPNSSFIQIADVPNTVWYPMTNDFHSSTPEYVGIAGNIDDYNRLVWYPNMTFHGCYKAHFGSHGDRTVTNIGNNYITIGSDNQITFLDFQGYRDHHPDFHLNEPWELHHYDLMDHPPAERHNFDHDKHFHDWNHKDDHDDKSQPNQPVETIKPNPPDPLVIMNKPNPINRSNANNNENNSSHTETPNNTLLKSSPILDKPELSTHTRMHTQVPQPTPTPTATPSATKVVKSRLHSFDQAHTKGSPAAKPTPSPSPTPTPTPTPTSK